MIKVYFKPSFVKQARELAADFRLRNCPEHRLTWEITEAMDRLQNRDVAGKVALTLGEPAG